MLVRQLFMKPLSTGTTYSNPSCFGVYFTSPVCEIIDLCGRRSSNEDFYFLSRYSRNYIRPGTMFMLVLVQEYVSTHPSPSRLVISRSTPKRSNIRNPTAFLPFRTQITLKMTPSSSPRSTSLVTNSITYLPRPVQ